MKKFLLCFMALFAFFAVNAAEVTVTAGEGLWTTGTDATYGEGYEITVDNVFVGLYKYNNNTAIPEPKSEMRHYKNAMMVINTTNGETITNVVFNCTGSDRCNDLTINGEVVTADKEANTITWSGQATELLAEATSAQNRYSSIVVTTVASGEPVAPSAPIFSPAGGTYYEAQSVTISATTGADIYYTLDGSTPTTESALYTEAIPVSETTTINAIAVLDGLSSNVATATYTISSMVEVANIAEFYALEEGTIAKITNPLTFIYKSGSYTYVKDETGYMLIYGSYSSVTYTNGDIIAAGVYGRRNTYNGTPQMHLQLVQGDNSSWSSDQFGEATGNNGEVAPNEVTDFSAITTDRVNEYLLLSNATFDATNNTLSDGTNTIAVYNRFSLTLPADGTYNVTGFVSIYNDAIQIYPTAFEEIGTTIEVIAPVITPDSGTFTGSVDVTITAEAGNIYYTTDGTTPAVAEDASVSGTLYKGSFTLTESATVNAIAVVDGVASTVTTATFTITTETPGEGVIGNINCWNNWDFIEAQTGSWPNRYTDYSNIDYDFALVSFEKASKQNAGTSITECPVIRNRTDGDASCTIALSNADNTMTAVTFNLKRWNNDNNTVTLNYSTDGTTFEAVPDVEPVATNDMESSATFQLTCSALPVNTKAVKITLSTTDRIGVMSADVTYATPMGVNMIESTDGVKVIGLNGEIAILGEACNVEVYTLGGALISKGNANHIDCPAGIYLVKVNTRVHKVIVK